MNEQIFKILKESKKSLSLEEICDILQTNDVENVEKEMHKLLEKYDAWQTPSGNYLYINNSKYRKGIYVSTKGKSGKVSVNGTDYLIKSEYSGDAIDGDEVLIEPIFTKKGNKNIKEGNVVFILNRDLSEVIGEVYNVNEEILVRPDNYKLKKLAIKVANPSGLVSGTKVVVKLEPRDDTNDYYGVVTRNIGYKDAPGVDIESMAYSYGFVKDFSEESLEELKEMPSKVSEEDCIGRLDLRSLPIFTIDGKDTKDIDDAISLSTLPNGNKLAGIHIADVTNYVKPGSALDKDAYLRATSGYFTSTVMPMLPQQLSNGLCSLNPNVDRLAMSIFAEIDENGKIVDSFITKSVIKSRKQMNYDDVNKVLNGQSVIGYEEFSKILLEMNKLSNRQIKRRDDKGALSLDDHELKIELDENGYPIGFKVKHNEDAENLIESFMLIANQVAPQQLTKVEAPAIFRVHEKPNIESLNKFLRLYRVMGYEYNKDLDNSCISVQSLLKDTEDKEEKRVLQLYLLRALMKAVYSSENKGHSGLAMEEYSQFTSPIRRYPDDILHRLLKEFVMCGPKYEQEIERFDEKIKQCYPDVERKEIVIEDEPSLESKINWEVNLPTMADHTSQREQQEVACERAVNRMKTAEYMMDHKGEEFEGTVTGVTDKGMFVELDENLINGMIQVSDLEGYFTYNESLFALENKNDNKSYHVGDRLLVSVMDANKERGTINFHLIKPLKQIEAHNIYQDAVQKIKAKKVSSHNKRPFNPKKHK